MNLNLNPVSEEWKKEYRKLRFPDNRPSQDQWLIIGEPTGDIHAICLTEKDADLIIELHRGSLASTESPDAEEPTSNLSEVMYSDLGVLQKLSVALYRSLSELSALTLSTVYSYPEEGKKIFNDARAVVALAKRVLELDSEELDYEVRENDNKLSE